MNKEDFNLILELCKNKIKVRDLKSIRTQRLGGLTNKNYKVDTELGTYVIRLPGDGTEEMINRDEEHLCTDLANQIDIDSQLIYFDDKTGIKICRYIHNAETMNYHLVRKRENMKAIAEIFKRLHSCGESVPVVFDVFEKIEDYENLLNKYTKDYFWKDYQVVKEQVYQLKDELEGMNVQMTMCHNDPLCENFIKGEDRMYLVDWEYAGMNDPMWDLADFFIEAELTAQEEIIFFRVYFGHAVDSMIERRILINKIFLDFLWSLWGKQRSANGEDLVEYANNRYKRAKTNLALLNKQFVNVI
ncbi:choline kinase family protein [Anaerophilus nitritogenes]|uniref:choline kinase family protein n=1 Tax=Anaerophilus nitritogenes TaxID=2498136 RepID=UPI00101D4891|nr:choline kinase family protein [Anaerophilus nitritogenes]